MLGLVMSSVVYTQVQRVFVMLGLVVHSVVYTQVQRVFVMFGLAVGSVVNMYDTGAKSVCNA